jgi:hypothetical protein
MPPPKRKPKPLSESTIQAHTIKWYESRGWLVNKIIQSTNNGWPDLECFKKGITEFVECKKEGGAKHFARDFPLQQYRHDELRKQGFTVHVIDYKL